MMCNSKPEGFGDDRQLVIGYVKLQMAKPGALSPLPRLELVCDGRLAHRRQRSEIFSGIGQYGQDVFLRQGLQEVADDFGPQAHRQYGSSPG